ncbi:MAG: hypothetical protein ABFE07_00445 [Armatimonadia bacterium]
MNQFEQLLAELNAAQEEQSTLAKAMPAEDGEDDEAIQAAAAEAGADAGDKNPEDDDDEEGDEPIAKSIKIGDEEVQVVDAEALVKSLGDLTGRVEKGEEVLTKGLTSALALIKGQGALIKSLQDQVTKLAGKGAGRKTVLTVHDKPQAEDSPLAKSQQDGLTPAEFLAKSHAAFDAKRITGKELTTIDVALRTNQVGTLDSALITKVIGQ